MMTVSQAMQLALQYHQAGRLAEAEALYRQILAVQPEHADALHLLGVIAHQAGRNDVAVERIRQSLVFNPNNASAHSNLGEALRCLGRVDEAMAAYRRAIEVEPNHSEALCNLGNVLRQRGALDEAIDACRCALAVRPHFPAALANLGNALMEKGRLDEAVAAYLGALDLEPKYAEVYNNLGLAWAKGEDREGAIGAYKKALSLRPDFAEASYNLGVALANQGDLDNAEAAYRQTLTSKPDHVEARNNLGNVARSQGNLAEAIAEFECAIRIRPDYAEAYSNLSIALREKGDIDEAIAAARRAIQLKTDFAEAYDSLGNALMDAGRSDDAILAYRHSFQLNPKAEWMRSNLILALHFHLGESDRTIADEKERRNKDFCALERSGSGVYANHRDLERRLRIGYVSPDLHEHVVGRNLLPLFEYHDHRQFEIFCYSGVLRPDSLTERFRERSAQWRTTIGMKEEALSNLIRQDEIDILVDLSQDTAVNRLAMFAHKPAPVQVSFAGYPESTGLEMIKYRISDNFLEGKSSDTGDRTEEVIKIDTFWCYHSDDSRVEVNRLPAEKHGWTHFGSFNKFCKVNEPLLKLWARVLRTVKDSRLILLSHRGSHRQRVHEFLEREGVTVHRVEFVEPRPREAYLELYRGIDIMLDTFPYNGHTTSLDALWMGVPVVSLVGPRAVSRAGLSQLTNLGLPELVARTEEEYVAIATRLAGDLPRLAELRATLRPRMEASVLMNAPHFARQIEAGYRTMWRQWCAENPVS